jgi:hypothetical protein
MRLSLLYGLKVLVLFALSFVCLQLVASYTLVGIDISHSRSDVFRIYWATASDANWTEDKSAAIYVNSRKQNHILRLPVGLYDIEKIRVDPGEHKGVVTKISEISLYNLRVGKVSFGSPGGFSKFEAVQHVTSLKAGSTLTFVSDGNDPGFMVDISAMKSTSSPLLIVAQAGLLALILMALCSRLGWLVKDLRWVPAGMLLVGCSIIVLAMISRQNAHPDEHVHLAAASYYSTNYFAPQVCSAESKFTYSAYGVSRLNNREIAYYVGGRYLQLVDFIPAADYLKLRFFNIVMFFVLILLAFRQVRARYLFLPLLLTPQAWYLFSYYNSDALSLFVVSLTAYQVFVPESMLRCLLRGERPPGYLLWVLGLGLMVAMQFWLKLNYMFYPILLAMLGFSWCLSNRRIPHMAFTRPLWIALALGAMLFLSWEVSRHFINDFAMSERVLDCREQLADTQFKPSTPLEKTHPNFRLKDKGVSLQTMLLERNWAERIFYTGLGAYGYTEYLNHTVHYKIASVFILLLLGYVIFVVALKGGAIGRLSVLSTLAALLGITAAAGYINWSGDYQPQGRYLMVYLPILGTLIVLYWQKLNVFWLSLLAAVPFSLGLYSFFSIALLEIARA